MGMGIECAWHGRVVWAEWLDRGVPGVEKFLVISSHGMQSVMLKNPHVFKYDTIG